MIALAVARQARILHQEAIETGSTEAAGLVERLTSDPRMRQVWVEIEKRRRQNYKPTATFIHPAKVPPSVDPGDVVARQAVAAGLLFHYAVAFRLLGARAIPTWLLDANPEVDDDDPLVVERDRGDAEARGYAICLLEICRRLFGSPMYRTVATIASVVLARKISPRAVQEWSDRQRLRPGSRQCLPVEW